MVVTGTYSVRAFFVNGMHNEFGEYKKGRERLIYASVVVHLHYNSNELQLTSPPL